jgi:hypothetical protein
MKKFVLFLILLFFCVRLYSQSVSGEENFRNEVRIGLFQFLGGTINFSYEHYFKPVSSIVAEGNFTLIKDNKENVIGGKAELQYRFYVKQNFKNKGICRLDGIFVGPYFAYLNSSVTDHNYYDPLLMVYNDKEFYYSTVSGGFIGGVKLLLLERFTFDLYAGGGVRYTDTNDKENRNSGIFERGYTGIIPRINFAFGIMF